MTLANQSVQPTGGSLYAQSVHGRRRPLPPVADAWRWANLHFMRKATYLVLLSLLPLCGCRSSSPQKSAGLSSLELAIDCRGPISENSIRLWMDGSFIGGYSREHPVLRVSQGEHTFRVVGAREDMSDDEGRPIPTQTVEEKIMILGGDSYQKMVVTLNVKPENK